MKTWRYRGRRVMVSATADIPTPYRLGHLLDRVVQSALDATEPWEQDESPIQTIELPERLRQIVVPTAGKKVFFARHAGHHARHVQPSPFVTLGGGEATTHLFTIELVGEPESPRLIRAYPGDYTPPLPWQNSSRDADGGVAACYDFWTKHAYVMSSGNAVQTTDLPPAWY